MEKKCGTAGDSNIRKFGSFQFKSAWTSSIALDQNIILNHHTKSKFFYLIQESVLAGKVTVIEGS